MTQAHEDPFGEARQRLAQTLAVAATVAEAAARWYAIGLQRHATAVAQQRDTQRASAMADRIAWQTQRKADRALIDLGLTSWLNTAGVNDTVRLWRTATVYAGAGNTRAAAAARRAGDRMRRMNPDFMNAYDRHRAAGIRQSDAMRAAAYDLWKAQAHGGRDARPHAGRPAAPALVSGRGLPAAQGDELDKAVRAEIARLADGLRPDELARLEQNWRDMGMTSAADALTRLRSEATAIHAAAQQDDRNSITSDERRTAVLDRSHADVAPDDSRARGNGNSQMWVHDDADADLAAAAEQQRLIHEAFPPMTSVNAQRHRNDASPKPGMSPSLRRGRRQ